MDLCMQQNDILISVWAKRFLNSCFGVCTRWLCHIERWVKGALWANNSCNRTFGIVLCRVENHFANAVNKGRPSENMFPFCHTTQLVPQKIYKFLRIKRCFRCQPDRQKPLEPHGGNDYQHNCRECKKNKKQSEIEQQKRSVFVTKLNNIRL